MFAVYRYTLISIWMNGRGFMQYLQYSLRIRQYSKGTQVVKAGDLGSKGRGLRQYRQGTQAVQT